MIAPFRSAERVAWLASFAPLAALPRCLTNPSFLLPPRRAVNLSSRRSNERTTHGMHPKVSATPQHGGVRKKRKKNPHRRGDCARATRLQLAVYMSAASPLCRCDEAKQAGETNHWEEAPGGAEERPREGAEYKPWEGAEEWPPTGQQSQTKEEVRAAETQGRRCCRERVVSPTCPSRCFTAWSAKRIYLPPFCPLPARKSFSTGVYQRLSAAVSGCQRLSVSICVYPCVCAPPRA